MPPRVRRLRCWRKLFLVTLLSSLRTTPCTMAQSAPVVDDQAKRQRAGELFAGGKRLEALPLLEELVQSNPNDDAQLVALAACLVDHAATLTNQEAAAKERFRARDLLDKAWQLGNTSQLAMNLAQLLHQLPASGAIKFSDNPGVEQAMRDGEAAFARRDFDEALKNYSRAMELEPKSYSAALFTGNTYDKRNEFAKGAEWYRRAIRLEPNVETAYRYYADMLARQGDMEKARAKLIHAAVAEPYNSIVWRELRAWASLNDASISQIYIGIPTDPENLLNANQRSVDVSAVWQAYRDERTRWQTGDEFKQHFPGEKQYRHSLLEESEALTAAANVLEKLKSHERIAQLAASDQSLGLLLKLHRAGLIDAYVLFSLGDIGISRDYAAYRAKNRRKLEEYMDKFVVPAPH